MVEKWLILTATLMAMMDVIVLLMITVLSLRNVSVARETVRVKSTSPGAHYGAGESS